MNTNSNTQNLSAPYQNIQTAAYISGLSQFAIRNGVKAGTIPHLRQGRKYLVHVPSLLEMMEQAAKQHAAV